MHQGKVKWFDNRKGYGFIVEDGQNEDIFVHFSAISGEGYRTLNENEPVQFEIIKGPKGLQAKDVLRSTADSSAEG